MRIIAIMLCLCMVFGLCACGDGNSETVSAGSSVTGDTGSQNSSTEIASSNNGEQGDVVTSSNSDTSSQAPSSGNAVSNTASNNIESSTVSSNAGTTSSPKPSTGTTSSTASSSGNAGTTSGTDSTSSTDKPPAAPPETTVVNTYGNTGFNIFNGGFVTSQGDWVYYINYSDNGYLYKMRTDGSNKQKLISIAPTKSLNVVGDWVYFFYSANDADYIYRVKTDGNVSYKRELPESYGGAVCVNGNYVNVDNMRLKADFTESTEIVKIIDTVDKEYGVTFFQDNIYFHINDHVHSAKLDGSEYQELDKQGIYSGRKKYVTDRYILCYDDNVMFFTDYIGNFDFGISSLRNGKIILIGDDFYYLKSDFSLVKENIATGERVRYNVYATSISVVGDYIYYRNYDMANKLYRIKTDGTGNEAV